MVGLTKIIFKTNRLVCHPQSNFENVKNKLIAYIP